MSEQTIERPVTVGYLKRLFERLSLPDDAILYHNDSEWGWNSVGPEGQEIMFITLAQIEQINSRAEEMYKAGDVGYGNKDTVAFEEFKEQSGQ